MQGKKYLFYPWIHGCLIDGALIILDTVQDCYYFLNTEDAEILLGVASNTFSLIKSNKKPLCSQYREVIKRFIDKKIITENCAVGVTLKPALISMPKNPFETLQCDEWPRTNGWDVFLVFLSGIKALVKLKICKLDTILNDIKRCRKHRTERQNLENILNVARKYHQLRPFLPKSRICLFDTISFFNFCKFYKVYPSVVFGVTADPFQAHCWAQVDDVILNDVFQNIKQYTPIMVI